MRKSLMNNATGVSADHRFPTPWTVKEQNGRFVVQDNNGQALSCVHFADKPSRRLFTRDEARYLAATMAKLPELLREGQLRLSPAFLLLDKPRRRDALSRFDQSKDTLVERWHWRLKRAINCPKSASPLAAISFIESIPVSCSQSFAAPRMGQTNRRTTWSVVCDRVASPFSILVPPGFGRIRSHARHADDISDTVRACFGVVLVQRLKT